LTGWRRLSVDKRRRPPQSDEFMPTSFSSALRTCRFNDIPSLIDFRTASCPYHLKGLELHFSEKACI